MWRLISTFVKAELKRKTLHEAGWTETTLQEVFDLDLQIVDPPSFWCSLCRNGFSTWNNTRHETISNPEEKVEYSSLPKRIVELQSDHPRDDATLANRNSLIQGTNDWGLYKVRVRDWRGGFRTKEKTSTAKRTPVLSSWPSDML
jgi:hypothetical protein